MAGYFGVGASALTQARDKVTKDTSQRLEKVLRKIAGSFQKTQKIAN